jgi:hypothetical protein
MASASGIVLSWLGFWLVCLQCLMRCYLRTESMCSGVAAGAAFKCHLAWAFGPYSACALPLLHRAHVLWCCCWCSFQVPLGLGNLAPTAPDAMLLSHRAGVLWCCCWCSFQVPLAWAIWPLQRLMRCYYRTEPVCSGAAAGAAFKCQVYGCLSFGPYSA